MILIKAFRKVKLEKKWKNKYLEIQFERLSSPQESCRNYVLEQNICLVTRFLAETTRWIYVGHFLKNKNKLKLDYKMFQHVSVQEVCIGPSVYKNMCLNWYFHFLVNHVKGDLVEDWPILQMQFSKLDAYPDVIEGFSSICSLDALECKYQALKYVWHDIFELGEALVNCAYGHILIETLRPWRAMGRLANMYEGSKE